MTYSCSIRTDWQLPAGDTAELYNAAKERLAAQSHKGWRVETYAKPVELIQANPTGFCVGIFTDNHRKNDNLISSQFIGVDYDDCDEKAILDHPLIQQYALAIGHTPSHGQPWRTGARLRVIFALDAPILKRNEPGEKSVHERYKLAVKALMTKLPTGYDRQCSDGARFYFGCKDWTIIQATNILPMTVLHQWHREENAREAAERADAPAASINTESLTAYVEKARGDELATLGSQSEGNRNNQLFVSACNLYGLVKAGALARLTVDNDLTNTARTLGLQSTAIQSTLRSAWDTADARDLSDIGKPSNSNGTATHATGLADAPILPAVPAVPYKPSFVFSDDAYDQFMDEMNGEKIPTVEPLINPYNFLHKFGGFGHVIPPGKVVYFGSIAGGWENHRRRDGMGSLTAARDA